ncbi:biotin transport system substrate-specific component [Tepidamorphus gemmatus]|jgi:biotin transport system substrate-specific component|uniref:Biotin transporter n=1 Tax=Tepidamorphus gemmatus TaxID=747076 RepID=A0A4R3MAZ0_9HYPH|nr:biotin transporter BioY [Tepidamorphus gemmatus]TCT09883.1 biotin transport system substrate-specific component [Tepidamorphus gemmatus]
MNAIESRMPTLAGTLWPARGGSEIVRNVVLALIGTVLLTISAKIMVPFWPVQMSMQTFAVMVIGAAYGPRLAGATVALYLLEGALGLPVFGRGAGLAYMAGPTGGYLIGFLAAAIVVGFLAERGFDRRWPTALAMFLIGDVIIFVFGLAWLTSLIGFEKAIAGGLMPFLPAEALKIALAMAVMPIAWKLVGRQ